MHPEVGVPSGVAAPPDPGVTCRIDLTIQYPDASARLQLRYASIVVEAPDRATALERAEAQVIGATAEDQGIAPSRIRAQLVSFHCANIRPGA